MDYIQRNHDTLSHVINGAVASAIACTTINFRKVKNEEMTFLEASRETVKRTSQGAIATGTAIVTTDFLSKRSGLLKALATMAVGIAGIYAIEALDSKSQNKKLTLKTNKDTIVKEK